MTTKEYVFTATGGWGVDSKLKPLYDASGNVVGFKLPDGREAQLVIALEVLDPKKGSYSYVTSEKQMDKLGFSCLDYSRLEFTETNNRYAQEV